MRLLILSTIVTLFWLQTALQQQQTASVEGIVVRAGTGAPIPGVQVKLTGVSSGSVLLTDSDGKFAFTNVPSGPNHHLSFALNGFVRKQYGQRSAFGSGIPFDLDAGKVMKGLVVSMTPTGSVDGRITDERGQPMEGIQVRLMRQFYSEHGEVGSRLPARLEPTIAYSTASIGFPQDATPSVPSPCVFNPCVSPETR